MTANEGYNNRRTRRMHRSRKLRATVMRNVMPLIAWGVKLFSNLH